MPSLLTTHHHHFDLHSADSLPDSYAWTPLDDHRSDGQSHLPIIDLDSPDAVHSIGLACLHWGAFHVINHRVPPDLLHRVLSETTRLFSLPTHRKLLAARSPNGVSGFGPARISRFFDKRFWSEGFTIVGGPPMDHARRLWSDRTDHTRFCETMGEYEKAMENLTGRLMGLALASFGLDERDAREFQGGPAVIQLNSYPACPDPGRAMGLAAHTDSTLLTVLHQTAGSIGLQVLHRDGRWVGVPPVPGALVVHVGDLLHVISNGRWESVVHRAVVDRDRHRYSVAYLCGPPSHVRVSPAPTLVGPGREAAAYRPVMWGEYLGLKARLFDGALASISVHNMQNKIKTKKQ